MNIFSNFFIRFPTLKFANKCLKCHGFLLLFSSFPNSIQVRHELCRRSLTKFVPQFFFFPIWLGLNLNCLYVANMVYVKKMSWETQPSAKKTPRVFFSYWGWRDKLYNQKLWRCYKNRNWRYLSSQGNLINRD